MSTYTCWAGYLPDHEFEPEETNCTYHEARLGVLDALDGEVRHAQHEADIAREEGNEREHEEWLMWAEAYHGAVLILQQTPKGWPFDVNIRSERFAVIAN